MISIKELEMKKIKDLENQYPFVLSFFENNKLEVEDYKDSTFVEYLNHFTKEDIEEWALDIPKIKSDLEAYINQMLQFLGLDKDVVDSITIIAGKDKYGNKENFDSLTIKKSEIVSDRKSVCRERV